MTQAPAPAVVRRQVVPVYGPGGPAGGRGPAVLAGLPEGARAAIQAAAIAERDFAGWLAAVLATVAAGLGSSVALVRGRPGSWEAADVLHLVRGTVGHDDEQLDSYRADTS